MEEDVGVKVTVTRLRRRLSVEQSEDGGSPAPSAPSTPSTPTKKRGGRLAAKPQLDLIDENTPVSSPRKTRRKSLATDAEEKPITPSRRSTRIKSNSSIVSETLSVQATDSPRAKRAARRNSQAGSDNEGPATPVRPTRRTRKDSASSVEQESGALIKPLPVVEMVIEEEPENELQKAVNPSKLSPAADSEELSPNSARKSKRLLEKRNRRSGSYTIDQDSSTLESKNLNISSPNKKTETNSQESPSSKSVKSKESNDNLSEFPYLTLLNNIESESNSKQSAHNKSTSALNTVTNFIPAVIISVENCINISDSEVSKKRKGKSDKNTSGVSINNSPKIDTSNTSISENNTVHAILDTSSERKKKKSETDIEDNLKPLENINALQVLTSKADNISNKDNVSVKSENSDVTRDMAKLFENTPENVQATVYFEDSDSNSVGASNVNKIEHLDSEDQCVPVVKHDFQENLSPKELGKNVNIVLSNQGDIPSTDINISKIVSDDVNDSCEPMDIDETIHEEFLQKSLDTLQHSNKSLNLSQGSINEANNNSERKSSISNSGVNTPDQSANNKRKTYISSLGTPTSDLSKNDKSKSSISNYEVNAPDPSKEENKRKSSVSNSGTNSLNYSKNDKSKSSITDSIVNSHQSKNDRRKSSISSSGTETPDKSKNNTDNKSTLILSQLKDVSSTSENKSPSLSNNEVLSKSDINEKSNQNKIISKNNLSLNDVKGTPKQTSIQKLTMQTSTPITTQQLGIKKKIEEQAGPKTTNSDFSKSMNDDTDCSEASGDEKIERSVEKSNLLNDEAEEASDDYESGDSQDEEDRRYEAENEIVERGVTLTSDDDVSNDTDYEKDSFVVSSDEEDDELLSGSGDDLSISDKELSMSKKSKKKFNERKLKEQKNASREMFESRHKLNTSDEKSANPKTKKNRMRIDSSLIASDEEVVVNPKKSNRMRLDSSVTESPKLEEPHLNKDKSKEGSAFYISDRQGDINISRKNNKPIRDSICDKSATNEREISVFNESNIDNADPLQVLVKQEPKTPQKDLNMSIVQFTDREEIENVQITEGISIINQTGTDPLQATMACEDSSDSSESEEILQNYDSVLNELNKENKTNFNKHNVSLNSGKKNKKNQMEPIIDQLNLTHTKKSKKNKDNMKDGSEIKAVEVLKEKQESDSEDSSGSIDLQLLFSEDNCGSDDDQNSQKNKPDVDNMFIPLKKSPGKTNIRDSTIGEVENQSIVDKSSSNKKRSSLTAMESQELEDTMNVSKNISVNESATRKKKKHYISEPNEEDTQDTVNVSKNVNLNESDVKKKKKHSTSEPAEEETQGAPIAAEPELNESTKKKKKRKTSLPAEPEGDLFFIDTTRSLQDNTDTLNISKSVNNSMNESGIKKKKKHSISEPAVQEHQETLNVSMNVNVSTNESGTKKHSISEPLEEETRGAIIADEPELNKSTKKKKKRKTSLPAEPEDGCGEIVEPLLNVVYESKKKRKKIKSKLERNEPEQNDTLNISKNVNNSMNESSTKKNKKHSISGSAVQENQENLNFSKNVNIYMNESGTKMKKKHSISEPLEEETRGAIIAAEPELNESTKKKKKRKTSLPAEPEDGCGEIVEPLLNVVYESKKKRKKIKSKLERNEPEQNDTLNISKNVNNSMNESGTKKKKKHSISEPAVQENQGAPIAAEPELTESSKKKKKRKTSLPAEPEGDLFFIDTTRTLQDNTENTIEVSDPPITPNSEKKKNKQKLEVLVHDDDSDGAPDEAPYQSEKASEMDLQNIESVSESADSAKKKHKKKKKKKSSASNQSGEIVNTENTIPSNSKKRKRNSSNTENSQVSEDVQESVETGKHNELVGSNKKRKISHNADNNTSGSSESQNSKKNKKKNRDGHLQENTSSSETIETRDKKNKKRKHRDDDGDNKQPKVKKDSSFQEVHVPRLPDSILRQLDDKPRKIEPSRVISTSNFIVENARQKRAKPSNYLEESIYLNEKSPLTKKQKLRIKKPKVLPFVPTASISDSGFTTNFKINKLSHTTNFEAEPVVFSKEKYLQKNDIKRLGTYDRYKKQLHHKMSKF